MNKRVSIISCNNNSIRWMSHTKSPRTTMYSSGYSNTMKSWSGVQEDDWCFVDLWPHNPCILYMYIHSCLYIVRRAFIGLGGFNYLCGWRATSPRLVRNETSLHQHLNLASMLTDLDYCACVVLIPATI